MPAGACGHNLSNRVERPPRDDPVRSACATAPVPYPIASSFLCNAAFLLCGSELASDSRSKHVFRRSWNHHRRNFDLFWRVYTPWDSRRTSLHARPRTAPFCHCRHVPAHRAPTTWNNWLGFSISCGRGPISSHHLVWSTRHLGSCSPARTLSSADRGLGRGPGTSCEQLV